MRTSTAATLAVLALFTCAFLAVSGLGDPTPNPEINAPSKVDAGDNFSATATDCDTPITVSITWLDTGQHVGGSPHTTFGSPNTHTYGPAGSSSQQGDRTLEITVTDGAVPPNQSYTTITVCGS